MMNVFFFVLINLKQRSIMIKLKKNLDKLLRKKKIYGITKDINRCSVQRQK